MEQSISLAQSESEKNDKILHASISDEMQKAYLDYAMSVIVARALPDARDGLKPVQRRIIYAMFEQGMNYNSRYQKSAAVIGEVLKKYHPHGDVSVYDALARMARDFSLRYPLIDGQGNFGSIDGDPPAAMRYTECRLSKISSELTSDIEKETVDFLPNYSGDYLEPILLPSVFPNLLLNGASGIAVGMATNIPPHNLGEVVDALNFLIENSDETSLNNFSSKATVEDILKFIKGPDFPTGGVIFNKKNILEAYSTGRGRIVTRGKCEIEEEKGKYSIIVTEIPYQVNKSELIIHIAALVKDKKIDGISDLRDESTLEGMRIVIELKRDARPQRILNLLYKHTELQKAFNCNFVALIDNEPKLLNLKTILDTFISHRQKVVVKRTKFLLKKAQEREHILLGLKIALDHIDEVIKTIRASKDTDTARKNLIEKFKLTEIQANAILEMQLRRLAALERQKIEEELAQIISEIKKLNEILANPKKVLEIIKEELTFSKEKFSDKRRTKVVSSDVEEPEDEELIKEEDVVITITKTGYIKRVGLDAFKKQGRGGKGVRSSNLKEDDILEKILISNTHNNVFFFTNRGRVYSLKTWDIPEASKNAKGTAVVNLLNLAPSEKVTAILPVTEKDNKNLNLFMVTRKGIVKKTTLSEFDNIRSSGIIAIKLSDSDTLEWVHLTTGEDTILLATSKGMSIKFSDEVVRVMGRNASGVMGIRLKKEDFVVGSVVIKSKISDPNLNLLVISEHGYGKKTPLSEYKTQNRGGSGILTYKTTEKTGKVVSISYVKSETSDILITSAEGQVIRLAVKDIPVLGRNTQGVRLIKLDNNDSVASFTTISLPL